MRSTAVLFTLSSLAASAWAATYPLKDSFFGEGFLSGFSHEAISDPTHGRVQYVDQATALAQNLTFASDTSLVMRADDTTVLDASGAGRNSVRIKSNNAYNTHVSVYDIRHMPQGCATWPAAWEVDEASWPAEGEIDILEGTNDIEPNQMTLHTSPNCAQPATGRTMTGSVVSTDCDTNVNGNQGCAVKAPTANSYGKSFNAAGGGYYAMERTTSFIKIWFWSRNDGSVPADVKTAGSSVNTDDWGEPAALFVSDTCDIPSHFGSHNIIINLTLCGDWAGQSEFFNTLGGCPGDCVTYVNQNPSAFSDAYWDIAGVHVYA
ncbi:2 beta-glucanase [Lentinus tigrinus ALCF2SS1-7]|uniref:2 beta-glucanase n=1 Tax=Lentinus tigrinus ALCF2SS1-7 TaxID=1328758 RepID=UPI001165D790|nr:2 beta-glucanase [Lentinus tigrinus ALCF2SS1-7]